ncbi:MAG: toxin co-regulated pilus biosynthesis Q family protein [Alphaproteobacteria bacterium]|nr:toxin co-regulated pilus biosynthesis Q family protein [Alphaproteobacteria bacterium]
MGYTNETNRKKTTIAFVLGGLFALTGCVNNRYEAQPANGFESYDAECADGICTSNQEYTAVCVENTDGYSECRDESAVNYTRTAADFRAYGERSPRDHRITQAGAGNNVSAAIQPSIDNEVIEYEAQVASTTTANGMKGYTPAQIEPTAAEETANKDWLAEEGQSLKDLLTQWSDESGWRLIWKTNRNYTLNAGAMFRGNFADVASALVRAFARARPAPIATFYKGNRVLVIETMEDENAYD